MLAEWVCPLPEGMLWPPGVPPGGGSWTPSARQMCLLPAASDTPAVQMPTKCRNHDCMLVTCSRASQLKQNVILQQHSATKLSQLWVKLHQQQWRVSTICPNHGDSPVQMCEPGLAQQRQGDGACCAHQSEPPGHMQESVALHQPPLSLMTYGMCSPARHACHHTV